MASVSVRSIAVATALLAAPLVTGAAQAGSASSLNPTVRSTVVGTKPTASTPTGGGGDPIFHPDYSFHSGVVSLIMTNAAGGSNICSGALAPDRQSVITAAHCVGGAGGTVKSEITSVTAYFHNGSLGPDAIVHETPSASRTVSDIFVNPSYTGDQVDKNDIAVLRLANAAPVFAKSYELDFSGNLTGRDFGFAGYGDRSTVGGATGYNAVNGMLRQGENRYDFRLGDAVFGNNWANILGRPLSQIDDIYLADFDSGRGVNDSICTLTTAGLGLSNMFCDRGRGEMEASLAPGDSGGPQFVDGKLTSIASFDLSFGAAWGDTDSALNGSFGELNGFVPISIHEQFILGHLLAVPEPATWLQMIAGFGLLGGVMRRARRGTTRIAFG